MKALIIGRWQPFHKGHMYLVRRALEDYGEVIIGVGSSEKSRTDENPFTFEEREAMIGSCFPGLKVLPVEDMGDDEEWVEGIDDKLKNIGSQSLRDDFVAVSMNDWTLRCFEKAGYKVKKYELLQPEKYDASSIRGLIRRGKKWKHLVPECVLVEVESLDVEEILKASKSSH